MSVSEIKSQLRELTAAEREEIANALEQIALENDAAWKAEMSRRIREMKAGKRVSREEVMKRCGISEEDLK